jgi:fructose-1,6-bisphosphatase/inositol monophosphatase family enzyme
VIDVVASIGFAEAGAPVAGLVYRPVPTPVSWAAGCSKENLYSAKLQIEATPRKGLLTSNGGVRLHMCQCAPDTCVRMIAPFWNR